MTDSCNIAVHAKPKAGKDAVMGIQTAADGKQEVLVSVRAAAEGGKANKAVCETVAKWLGASKSSVRVVRGDTSRHKMLEISVAEADVAAKLDSLPKL